ncbi:MAG: lamin tail domain-containing protein [Melioribacteraceae bacterium]|nr:lamin tail domain-containing protein [Melioribacteraceae bacterium]
MRRKAIIFFITIAVSYYSQQPVSSLVFSEVMFAPEGSDNEFVELYNLSATDTIDLKDCKIIYYTSSPDIISDAGYGTKLLPHSFAVILESDYNFSEGVYNNLIPADALVLKLDNNSFGSSGMSNSSDRKICLLNSFDDTLDVYTYTADNQKGVSDEKIYLSSESQSFNWSNSLVINGTPGSINSVSPRNYDLEISKVFFIPETIYAGDAFDISVLIKNLGLSAADSTSMELYEDRDKDSLVQISELLNQKYLPQITPGDSAFVTFRLENLTNKEYSFIIYIKSDKDENVSNNNAYLLINILPGLNNYGEIVINEIMYKPKPGEPEWIELFNNTSIPVKLKNWRISDLSSSVSLSREELFINPREYLVVSDDDVLYDYYEINSRLIVVNLPSLNNSGDNLKLLDSLNRVIDSVNYKSGWSFNYVNASIEKISPAFNGLDSAGWGPSISIHNATPGSINSISPKMYDVKLYRLNTDPEILIKDKDIIVSVLLKNNGSETAETVEIKFYIDADYDSTALASELYNSGFSYNISPGDSLEFSWAIKNQNSDSLQIIIEAEFSGDEFGEDNRIVLNQHLYDEPPAFNDIVISEIMYNPPDDEPEWIELYNKSADRLNLKNWMICDKKDSTILINDDFFIDASDYVVLSSDESLIQFYNIPSEILVSDIPTLNNSGDKIILTDNLSNMVDSLTYKDTWCGSGNNLSLERISYNNPSGDSANWSCAREYISGTPGRINSVSQKNFDVKIEAIYFNPYEPVIGDSVFISALVKNKGREDAAFNLKLLRNNNDITGSGISVEEINNIYLVSADSIIITFVYTFFETANNVEFTVEAHFKDDQDTQNNFLSRTLDLGYPYNSIIINEIQFNPADTEPEWFELFNNADYTVNISGWSVSDIYNTPKTYVIKRLVELESGGFLVVSRDSSIYDYHNNIPCGMITAGFANLNNDIDGLIIKDIYNNIIDSVFYRSVQQVGKSYERVNIKSSSSDPNNWLYSADALGSSPGRVNSVVIKEFDLTVAEIFSDPLFPVLNDQVFIGAVVKNIGKNHAQNFSVQFLYLSEGILHTLETIEGLSLSTGDSVKVKTKNGFQLLHDVTMIINIIYASDNNQLNNTIQKSLSPGYERYSIIITEFMSDPPPGMTEWIELFNKSENIINIKNWSISDVISTPLPGTITHDDFIINPGDYFIVARDSTELFFNIKAPVFYQSFGGLGNSQDGIVLYDFRNAIIDSIFYTNDWNMLAGHSLERIEFNDSVNDPENWMPSLDLSYGTPGRKNSASELSEYKNSYIIINEILYDPAANNSEFIELLNISDMEINTGQWKLKDANGNASIISSFNRYLSSGEFLVLSSDSLMLTNYMLNKDKVVILNRSWQSLSNEGESIRLTDAFGNTIDSVFYKAKWHNKNIGVTKNISLERINPSVYTNDSFNWSSSVAAEGATPGSANSIYTPVKKTSSVIEISPNPFSPDNDGYEDFTVISYKLKSPSAQIKITIYDDKGRKVRTLANNMPSSSTGSIIFDGLDDNGNPMIIGMYILLFESSGTGGYSSEKHKKVFVVARKF